MRQNFARLAASGEFQLGLLHTLSQVHGDAVLEVKGAPREVAEPAAEGDGLFTQEAELTVGVKTADCVPILAVAPDIRAVAAVHSGWKGTLAAIAARAVERLRDQGADPRKMLVALGPSIRRCCYEISGELGDRFRARFGSRVLDPSRGRGPHLDLVHGVRADLEQAGVPHAQIEVLDACTACDASRFFSHRRDAGRHAGQKGLHLSFAVCRFA